MNDDKFDSAAGHWRLSVHNQEQYLEALITRLQTSLPGTVTVTRAFAPFSKKKPLKKLQVALAECTYSLEYTKSRGIQTMIGTAVRGIVLKNEAITFPQWMQSLHDSVQKISAIQSQSEDILEDFLL